MGEGTPAVNVLWLTTQYPWPGDPIGGTFHRTAARSLVQAGISVTVLSPTPVAPWPLPMIRKRWRRYAQAPRSEVDKGVRVLRPRYPAIPGDPGWSRSDGSIWLIARRFVWAHPEIDLIHAHYPAPMGMAAWRLGRSNGLPYLVTLHGDDEVWRSSHRSRLPVYRQALREAARVLAVSRPLAEEAHDLAGVDATVLPIGVDLDRFAIQPRERGDVRRELGFAEDRIVILLVAVLEPRKGIRPFVDALIELGRPFLGVIVGEGSEAGYRASDAEDVVVYSGAQPNEAIPRYLAGADMLVLPSEAEGLPTVLVEAGAARVPVIASAVGGIPDLVGADRGILLPEVSPRAIADAISVVRADPASGWERAERLHRLVVEEYDAAANGRRLAEVYRAVLAERSLAGRRAQLG